MIATIISKLIPYKTLIIIGVIVITLGSGLTYINILKSSNDSLMGDNQILIDNNEILSQEKVKWVNAMKEQVLFTAKLEKSKIISDRSMVRLRNKLNTMKYDVSNLDGSVESNSKLSIEFSRQLSNSYDCISRETGHKTGCIK